MARPGGILLVSILTKVKNDICQAKSIEEIFDILNEFKGDKDGRKT